jgi:hypothetical protein
MFADAVLAFALLVLLSIFRFGQDWLNVWAPLLDQPAIVAFAYGGAWVAVLWLHGLYRPRARWTIRSEGLAIARAAVVLGLITGTFLFAFRVTDASRLFLLLLFPMQWLLTLATRVVLRIGFEWLRAKGYNTRYVLMVGTGPRGQAFARKLEAHKELGLEIVGFVDDEKQPSFGGWPYLGTLDQVEDLLEANVVDEIAMCLPFTQWDKMNAIAHLCEESGKIVRVPVDVLDHAFASGRFEDLDGTPVYSLVSGPDRALALFVKRSFDVVVAGFALVVGSPVLLAIALAIRMRDGSPVLFRQTRIGLHGRQFEMLKFRSMAVDAEQRLEALLGVDRHRPELEHLELPPVESDPGLPE